MAAFIPHWFQPSAAVANPHPQDPTAAITPYGAPNDFSQQSQPGIMWAPPAIPSTHLPQQHTNADEQGGVIQGANPNEVAAVFVKGFPKYTGSATLRALFQLYGNVTRVYIPAPLEEYKNPQKPYGVVYYDNAASARLAVAKQGGHRPVYILEHELDSLPQDSKPYAEFWQQESVILHVELYDIRKKGKKHSLFVNRAARQAHRTAHHMTQTAPYLIEGIKPETRQRLFQGERKSLARNCFASIADGHEYLGVTPDYRPQVQASLRATDRLPRLTSPPPGLQVEVESLVDVNGGRDSVGVPLDPSMQSRLSVNSPRIFVSDDEPPITLEALRLENTRLKAELAALQTDDKLYISDEETHFSKETLLQILNAQRHEMHYQRWQSEQKQIGQVNSALV